MLYYNSPEYVKNVTWKKISTHDDNNIKGFFGNYRFLSNMWKCKIQVNTYCFPSVENAYQAFKRPISDWDVFEKCSPIESKSVNDDLVVDNDWHINKFEIMYCLNKIKYQQHDLKYLLLSTEEKYLEETNWWDDKFWGVCKNVGENNLGKILMEIRKNIRNTLA
jgi:predicted NAD-dependent protein-ADP-ribosyltransferase YbiA (DUF1768 family)